MAKYVELARVQKTIMRMTNDVRGADIAREVGKIPAADVHEVKHAKWKRYGDFGLCENCEHVTNDFARIIDDKVVLPRYCSNCGAKIEVEE